MCGNPIAGPGGRKRARSTRSSSARRKRFSSAVLEAAARPTLDQQATSILPPLNVKTARSWRGIVPFTHLAREGRMTVTIGRRELLVALGGAAAAWPLAAHAQQPAVPVIGFLSGVSSDGFSERIRAFRQGLKETGYVEGESVMVAYRWAENQIDQLP